MLDYSIRDVLSKSDDVYENALKKADLFSESNKESHYGSAEKFTYELPVKMEDGKIYDKHLDKVYDSADQWVKSREAQIKRYEGTAKFCETKAAKEYARFVNAYANGISETEKWKHYQNSQKYFDRAKELKSFADNIRGLVDKANEITETPEKIDYNSTYEERLSQTPVNNGFWKGERGESRFCSENQEANSYLNKSKVDGINYQNAIPDFSIVSKGDVKISEMSENRVKNFKQADIQLANQKGCTPREVSDWRERNSYTWHECNDLETCQKIPSCVNSAFGHFGGVGEYKKQMKESEFDE